MLRTMHGTVYARQMYGSSLSSSSSSSSFISLFLRNLFFRFFDFFCSSWKACFHRNLLISMFLLLGFAQSCCFYCYCCCCFPFFFLWSSTSIYSSFFVLATLELRQRVVSWRAAETRTRCGTGSSLWGTPGDRLERSRRGRYDASRMSTPRRGFITYDDVILHSKVQF